ncbi:restriction endonuclease subunit S [Escherichia coli]|uniref:restriction endonuclease subunit S n=1 Tax=Escherichia coli TaxID=562 RepID=UPI002875A155|nr:restriction endonuclease subunit S [Escherichia coli]
MGSKWEKVRLGDYCIKIGSGATPKGGSSVYTDTGNTYFIRSQNIYNDGFNTNGLVFINDEAAFKLKNVEVQENDVLINITGDSVARVCIAPGSFLPARVNQHVAIIRPKSNEFDSRFLRYFLSSPHQQALLLTLASAGATRHALTKGMIEDLQVPKPPLNIQISIANILEFFDKKIEKNNYQNQTLEKMSQTLFKSWFVDFDPVIDNALDAGNPIPEALQSRAELRQKVRNCADFKPLPAEIRSLFPSEFEETELGWVPKGWKIDNIGGLSDKIFSGGTPNTSTEEYWNGALNWFSSGETRNALIIETEKKITATGVKNSSTRLSVAGDILIASAGQGHTRGQTSLNTIDTYINQSVVCIRSIKPSYSTWLYFNLSSRYTEMRAISDSHSIRGSLTTKLISSMKVASPTDELISLFDINCSVFISKIKNNLELSRELKKLRDTLLPKLISGELSLEDLPDLTTDTEAA